jgi:hypothetical protein
MNNENNEHNITSDILVDFDDNNIIIISDSDINEKNRVNDRNIMNKVQKCFPDFDESNKAEITKFINDTYNCELEYTDNKSLNFYNSSNKKNKIKFSNNIYNIEELCKNENKIINSTVQVETNCTFNFGLTLTNCNNKHLLCTPYDSLYLFNKKEVNPLESFFDYILSFDNSIKYSIQNGNLMFDTENDLKKVNSVLHSDMSRRRDARNKIITCHNNSSRVVIDKKHYNYTFHQIYCYVPNPNLQNFNKNLWKGLIELFLEAMYENVLFSASLYQKKNNVDSITCYLVPLGEKYNIEQKQIARAIQRACHIASIKDIKMNVELIHENNLYNEEYSKIASSYPLSYVNINSVWDTNF